MRTAFAWISILLATLVLGGCSRAPKRTEALSTSGEALSTVMTRTYGFESLTDWFPHASSPTLALSNTHTEGLKSLAVSGGGWSSVISRALSKEEAGPDIVGFDLQIPTPQPNPSWFGTIELFVDIPSRGVHNQPLGTRLLTQWTPGQWRRAEFNVPGWIKTAMNGVSYSDLKWRIQLNVPTNSTGQYLFDKFFFGPTPPACTPQSDNNACTLDTCDANGQQQHTPVPAGTSCSDGNACNGAETCNATGTCTAGTPVVCTASDQCHDVGTCNPSTGVCSNPEKPNGSSCADATVCNGTETCSSGTCVAGTPPALNDDNPCTADACDPVAGVTHTPVAAGTSCANGNACDGTETCNGTGECTAGTPVVCVATDQCHDIGTCNPLTGACSNPAKPDGASCSDGSACTTADACQSGACVGANPVACVASDACHAAGTCDPATGACSDPPLPNGTACDDATVCNGLETCSAGACVAGNPVDPDDDNPCTADGCDPVNGAFHDPVAAGTSCETDADACNGTSACDGAGACQPGAPPVLNDDNQCTEDACDPIAGVTHAPVAAGTSCTDTNACNGDEVCNAFGACLPGPTPVLDDDNPCTIDACDPALGVTHTPAAAGASCANATVCDGAEACDGAGTCQAGTLLPIDDGNPCTADTCDPVLGVTHPPVANGTSCADSDVCNGAETCQAGTCTAGTPLVTDDDNVCTLDTCDALTGVSHSAVADGTTCADADLCDGSETCQAGACAEGTPVVTDDGNVCTTDACDPATGTPTHSQVENGSSCANANVCDGAETCQSGSCAPGAPLILTDDNACTDDTCDPVTGVAHTPRAAGSSCSDFDLCNGNETCDAAGTCLAGTPVPIDTTNVCTTGSCDPATGVVTYTPTPGGTSCAIDICTEGECNGSGECTASGSTVEDDGDPCTIEWCDPVTGPQVKTCSAIDPTVGTTIHESTKWLFEQPNPVQVGVAPGTISVQRAVALRGRVKTRDGSPLPGVMVTVLDHPEFGHTLTQSNGYFDMVVNGGTTLTVDFQHEGYLRAGRAVAMDWQERLVVDDVVLMQPDPLVTPVDLTAPAEPLQVVQGSIVTDEDGTRQGTLLVPAGTEATMHLSDGTTVDLASMNVRITEFTAGDSGQAAMPQSLPPESKYTYAFEINADEAVAADAPSITFSDPLIYYVDNFLYFPAGTAVPLGSLDRDGCGWAADESGIVLDIIGEVSGAAEVDVTGDGVADVGSALAQYGITNDELEKLAALYDPGRSLWRVLIPHFTQPWDANWNGGPPSDAETPAEDPPRNDPDPRDPDDLCNASTIECQKQALLETLPIAGTPYTLNYSSLRVPGRVAANQLEVPLSGATIPASLLRIDLDVTVAGVRHHQEFAPAPNLTTTFAWNGLDAFGRRLQGVQAADVNVSYVYQFTYERTDRFGYNGNGATINVSRAPVPPPPGGFPEVCSGNGCVVGPAPTRTEISIARSFTTSVGGFDARDLGLGGWTLDTHHVHQLVGKRLELGTGERVDAAVVPPVLTRIASYENPGRVRIGPDGSIYRVDADDRIWRRPPGLPEILIAGNANAGGYGGDGVPATDPSVRFNRIADIDLGCDGSLYIADQLNHIVRRIGPEGIIRTIAGVPGVQSENASAPEGPAIATPMSNPRALAVSPDCTVFVSALSSVMRIAPDGNMNRVVGMGGLADAEPVPADGTVATTVAVSPHWLDLGPDGALYVSIEGGNAAGTVFAPDVRIIKVVDGLMYHVAGRNFCVSGCPSWIEGQLATSVGISAQNGIAVDTDGKLYLADMGPINAPERIASITPDGRLLAEVGTLGTGLPLRQGVAATNVRVPPLVAITTGPDKALYLSDPNSDAIYRVASAFPTDTGAASVIASRDSERFYSFDKLGRHLSTKHALTGANLATFGYDGAGRLISVTDEAGKVTTIERNTAGTPTAIVAPFGQRTELQLDADGYLEQVTDPEGHPSLMSYDDGLLVSFTNARGLTATMQYNELGHLELDTDAAGGSHSLVRTENGASWSVSRSTALGRTTTYTTDVQLGNRQIKTVLHPDQTTSTTSTGRDKVLVETQPDGTLVTTTEIPDERFGLNAPLLQRTTTLPSGLSSIESTTRTYTGLSPTNVLSFSSRDDIRSINGRNWLTGYVPSTRLFTMTSPAGRTTTRTVDTLGRTTRTQTSGLARTDYQYDTSGRLLRTIQGTGPLARTTEHGYTANGPSAGYLETILDPRLDTTTFARDSLGRVLTETRASTTTAFTWDELNNLQSVTPPGKPTHAMTHTPVNLLETYTPPPAGLPLASTGYTYDLDRMLRTETRPDGVQIIRTPDSAGRLDTVTIPGGMLDYDYYPPGTPSGAGKTSDILGPYGTNLHFVYDGKLTTSVGWSGDVTGSVAWQYNTDFNKIRETVTGQTGTSFTVFGYDNDQLPTCASWTSCSGTSSTNALRLARDPQRGGLITQIALGNTTETLGYNTFGELARQTSAYSASPIADITYDAAGVERDKLGRIVQKTEIVLGVTKVYQYAYDALRRLTDVTVNGVLEEHFEYDANGNRTAGYKAGVGTWAGTYDDQDRLLTYGPWVFTYTANGELETKTNTETDEEWLFQYDALGNLLSVGLPNGDLVEYLVDGMGRRVGKKKNGVLLRQWVYRDALKPAAELDGAGNLVAQYAYGLKSNVPDYVRRGTATYRVISDHLGSPRYVVNVNDASDVPFTASYSSFGEVAGTGLDWMAFGFAGGIYDSDAGLVRFGARDYDPLTGRWTTKDPLRHVGGINLFAYATNDPINRRDGSGRTPEEAAVRCAANVFACRLACGTPNPITAWACAACLAKAAVWDCKDVEPFDWSGPPMPDCPAYTYYDLTTGSCAQDHDYCTFHQCEPNSCDRTCDPSVASCP